jgi:hypothetical protein
MVVVDPFLWHREAPPPDGRTAYGVYHQFCRPFLKPHADYCAVLGRERIAGLPAATQRFLGLHARIPSSLAEFYLPGELRPYRPGQW